MMYNTYPDDYIPSGSKRNFSPFCMSAIYTRLIFLSNKFIPIKLQLRIHIKPIQPTKHCTGKREGKIKPSARQGHRDRWLMEPSQYQKSTVMKNTASYENISCDTSSFNKLMAPDGVF